MAATLRVVHVCGELGYYGAENVVAQLVRHTREPDLELAVMTVNRWQHPEMRAALDVPLLAIERNGRRDLLFLARMIAAIRRLHPAIVHTHAHHGRYWGRLAAVLAGVPLIVHTEHNSDLVPPRPRALYRALNRSLRDRTAAFVDFTARRADALAAAEGIARERVVVIPNAVPLHRRAAGARERARASLGVGEDELAVVMVARLFAPKRLDRAIDALAALAPPLRRRVRLLLLGDGPLREALTARAHEREVESQVRFLGFRPDARDLLAGADVALATSAHEAMPLALIEAMVEGIPIVTTPWDGAAELLGGGAFGFVAGSHAPEAIAAALTRALAEPDEAAARADAARAHARAAYDVDAQARRYAALYRALSAGMRAASPAITAARS